MMSFKYIILNVCLISFSMASFALTKEEAEQIFLEAYSAYENGDYIAAVESFELISPEFESPALFKNLGNSYFRSNSIAMAILNYEKALKLNPRDKDVAFNLSHANALTKDRLKNEDDDKFENFINSITCSFSANIWAYISLAMVFIFFAFLFLMYLTKRTSIKRSLFYASFLSLLLVLGSIYFGYSSKKLISTHTHCIIIDPKVDVKSEPAKAATDLFILHEGSKVLLLESRNLWIQIQIPNGTKGWVEMKKTKKI